MTKDGEGKNQGAAASEIERQGLKVLLDISQSLHEHRDFDDLISNALKHVTEATQAEMASIILYDEKKNEFIFFSSTDTPEHRKSLLEMRFPADQGIASSVFKSGKGELILNVSKDPRHFKNADNATGLKTKSMAVVPLKTTKKITGVLEVLNKKVDVFNKKDLNFLTALSPIIALALDNARIHTELETAYNDLRLIDLGKDDLIRQTENELAILRQEIGRNYRFDQIIGNSESWIATLKLCERAIGSDITVLIEGETGTGKELIARAIHYNSARKTKPFVVQNCAGIPDNLLASELFGHKKGAYTGAYRDKKGLFEIAHSGTIFLDELAEMSSAMQSNLLRVLQSGDIRPLGSEANIHVDVRTISATNKNLSKEVLEERFREDLFYRLNVFTMNLPPLRERAGDIPILANYFLKRFCEKTNRHIDGFTSEAIACMSSYHFPGNVRELENEIERATAMAGLKRVIDVSDLSERIRLNQSLNERAAEYEGTLKQMVETLEKSILSQTLEKHGGNKTKAARELGLSRYGLSKKIERYGL